MRDTVERFNARHTPRGDCFEWTGTRNRKGYGLFKLTGVTRTAHRVAYLLFVGPIPEGMHVMHRCDNPPCVNPDHLFLGTAKDNEADKIAKGRRAYGERTPGAKLRDADIPVIRGLAASGCTTRGLARRYGVNETTMGRLIRGKTWTKVA